ncbi:MAG: phosphopantetheine adenylyltransferase [Candidatus Helarchaeota archaeon]
MKPYNKVGVAGTFAQFHVGHEILLKTAFKLGNIVVIALTVDDMIKSKKNSDKIPNFNTRKENLTSYLRKMGFLKNVKIVELKDKYGTAITDKDQDAIVVSEDTYKTAIEINIIRRKSGLDPLTIISIPLVFAKDAQPISSTRIRAGEIDEKGNLLK